jgi:hypothetical protein
MSCHKEQGGLTRPASMMPSPKHDPPNPYVVYNLAATWRYMLKQSRLSGCIVV